MFDFECLHLGVNYEEECPLLLRSLHMCLQAEYRWYPCFLSECGCPLSWDRNGSPLILSNLEKETKDDSNKKSIIIAAIIRANYTK